jgi:threonine synthase
VKYVSTRGTAPVVGFDDVLLTGLANDGGLYVPETFPPLGDGPADAPYADVALEVMWPYVDGSFDRDELKAMIDEAYATFDTPDVAPLVDLGGGQHVLELFHGPTLAFKDVALQLVGRLFDAVLARRGERLTIVVATSGDTGSAAIEACRGRSSLDIVVLFPDGRVSEVQRRLMTTVDEPNVHCVALDGTFDDCQDLVKALFNDAGFRARHRLSAMNSINWARILAQVVYYVTTVRRLGPQTFAVPTGNFGNVLAGDTARRMGVPVERLVVASNANDILYRWLETGVMAVDDVVHATTSPAMDIQISSNAERLLFELYDRNGAALAEHMVDFRRTGRLDIGAARLARLREDFEGARVDDAEAAAVIRRTYERTGVLVDPHTAVGLGALGDRPGVALATAAPAKFPDAVEAAVGVRPGLPAHLADLLERPERYERAPNDIVAVADLVAAASL